MNAGSQGSGRVRDSVWVVAVAVMAADLIAFLLILVGRFLVHGAASRAGGGSLLIAAFGSLDLVVPALTGVLVGIAAGRLAPNHGLRGIVAGNAALFAVSAYRVCGTVLWLTPALPWHYLSHRLAHHGFVILTFAVLQWVVAKYVAARSRPRPA